MTSAPPTDSAVAAPVPAPAVVGFQTKKPAGLQSAATAAAAAANNTSSLPSISPERMAYLEATLAKLPELDLSEMARVKACFASALGETRENIINGLELRVVLGDLGLYPSEEELKMVLRAYRDRVNLVGLARYLRLYKKEFWLNQVAARSGGQQQQQQQHQQQSYAHPSQQNAGAASHVSRRQLAGAPTSTPPPQGGVAHTYTAFSGSHARAAAAGAAGGGNNNGNNNNGSDEDTLRAFVALGGEEDGSGEISASTLRDAVRGFGLTIDIDAMIRTVDVHHSGMLDYVDFCALWAAPADAHGADSMGHALRQASADAEHRGSVSGGGASSGLYPSTGANRRLMSVLQTPSHRSSVAGGALHQQQQQRRSYAQAGGYDGGASLPMTPRLGANAVGRPLTSTGNNGPTDGTVAMTRPAITAASLPAPITEEEHVVLVRMFLFPDQFESTFAAATAAASGGAADTAGRRGGARFMLPSRIAQVSTPSHAAATATATGANAVASSTTASVAGGGSVSGRRGSQKQLSRSGKNGTAGRGTTSRSRSQKRAGGTRGRKNGEHDDGNGADDLAADFFSPKNQNVYRPPSPMLLSMRNSTAYRNRVKRLEEQKHAARGGTAGGGGGDATMQQQQQQGGMHAATMAGRDGYGADGDSGSRPAKSATW